MSGKRPPVKIWLNARAVWDILGRLNLSQNQLANLLGLTPGYLSQLLNRKRSPSPPTRRRLQEILNAGFDELFVVEGGDEN